jgi:hypothetical protein
LALSFLSRRALAPDLDGHVRAVVSPVRLLEGRECGPLGDPRIKQIEHVSELDPLLRSLLASNASDSACRTARVPDLMTCASSLGHRSLSALRAHDAALGRQASQRYQPGSFAPPQPGHVVLGSHCTWVAAELQSGPCFGAGAVGGSGAASTVGAGSAAGAGSGFAPGSRQRATSTFAASAKRFIICRNMVVSSVK